MTTGIFANYADSNLYSKYSSANQQTGTQAENKNKNLPVVNKKEKFVKKAKEIAPIVLPLVAIPVTALVTYKLSTKSTQSLKKEVSALTQKVGSLTDELSVLKESGEKVKNTVIQQAKETSKADAKIWSVLLTLSGMAGTYQAGKMSNEDKNNVAKAASNRLNNIEERTGQALNNASVALQGAGPLTAKYTTTYNGITLLSNNTTPKDTKKYETAIESIEKAAPTYLYERPKVNPINKENPVLWSVTSEFAPMKEGGLGSVPVDIQSNFEKLGVKTPTFLPMYQESGVASLVEENGNYIYKYNDNYFVLDNAATYKVDAYQDGKTKEENVDIFVVKKSFTKKDIKNTIAKELEAGNKITEDKAKQIILSDNTGKYDYVNKLILVKNDHYFNGKIYSTGEKTEEPEKFAFFSKAVYEFAKIKEDKTSAKDLKINNSEAFNSIPQMDGLILNDWHAAPIAALARYKAPLENAFGQLSNEASEKLRNINIITIGHNAMYQGSTNSKNNNEQRYQVTSNILNTLFDNYADTIYTHAKTNAYERNKSDEGLKNLDNTLIINPQNGNENHTNLLNMGICLSNYFCPVSKNYAKELISPNHKNLAGELQWALTQKDKSKSMVGIINGNDFKKLSIEGKAKNIKDTTDLDYELYKQNSDISDVMKARKKNKINFYNNYIVPLSQKNSAPEGEMTAFKDMTSNLDYIEPNEEIKLTQLPAAELEDTPIIASVGRLVSQKGINIMADAIEMLYENWETDFPNNEKKPIFYIAGSDGEEGKQRKFIYDLKNEKLDKEDSKRVIFAHGFAPFAAMAAASDFFLLPSVFEPCGLTQSEAFAVGTPVIASAVGGIIDTVNRNNKFNGVLTDKNKNLTAQELYEAMKKGLKIYFEDKNKYQNMVKDSLTEDFSWYIKGKDCPSVDYLKLAGIDVSKY